MHWLETFFSATVFFISSLSLGISGFFVHSQVFVPGVTTESVQATTSSNAQSFTSILPRNVSEALFATSTTKYDLIYRAGFGVDSIQANWVPDIQTFKKLDDWYFEDKAAVYSKNPQSGLLDRMAYVERNSFTTLTPNGERSEWAKDNSHVYDYGQIVLMYDSSAKIIGAADPATFSIFPSSNYAKDKVHVFYSSGGQYDGLVWPLEGADPSTFSTVSSESGYDAQDKNHKYKNGEIVRYRWVPVSEAVGSDFFEKEGEMYVHNHSAGTGTPLPEADPVTFVVADSFPLSPGGVNPDYSEYGKDKKSVFFLSTKIEGADSNSFFVLSQTEEGEGYAKDSDHVYWDGISIQGADVDTFTVEDAYLSTCLDSTCSKSFDATDRSHKYSDGKVVQ